MAITVDTFDLSLRSPETGRHLTANVYFVDGVTDATGAPRALSIGELVMALCLDRASKLEAGIITLMEQMNSTSSELEALTEIESEVVSFFADTPGAYLFDMDPGVVSVGPYAGKSWRTALYNEGIINSTGVRWIRSDAVYSGADILLDDFVTNIEAKMDEMNSFSQQKMIELQSQTAKRDQAYDMVSNILKSLNTVLVGNVNNM